MGLQVNLVYTRAAVVAVKRTGYDAGEALSACKEGGC